MGTDIYGWAAKYGILDSKSSDRLKVARDDSFWARYRVGQSAWKERWKISLHLCLCEEHMFIHPWIVLTKLQFLSDSPRILSLNVKKSSSCGWNQLDENWPTLGFSHLMLINVSSKRKRRKSKSQISFSLRWSLKKFHDICWSWQNKTIVVVNSYYFDTWK